MENMGMKNERFTFENARYQYLTTIELFKAYCLMQFQLLVIYSALSFLRKSKDDNMQKLKTYPLKGRLF